MGLAHGAGTIVNAIASGKGAAFGLDLRTEAEVELNSTGNIEVIIDGSPQEDPSLVELCVHQILQRFDQEDKGAKVRTWSQIPISKGLKSSSAAANACIKATLRALGEDMQILDAIKLGCRCAIEARVSVTGAFDDACASMLGGIVVTDNRNFELLNRERMDESLVALVHVPDYQIRKMALPRERIEAIRELVDIAFYLAAQGEYRAAMKLNGIIYSSVLGVDPSVMHEALAKGAVAAGLSGTGPATVILVEREMAEKLREELSDGKNVMLVEIFNCD